jgi:predicted acetyltransferase
MLTVINRSNTYKHNGMGTLKIKEVKICNNKGTWAVVSLRRVIKPARSTELLRPYNFSGYVEDKSVNPPPPRGVCRQ